MTTSKNAAKKAAQTNTPQLSPEEIEAKRAEAKAKARGQEASPAAAEPVTAPTPTASDLKAAEELGRPFFDEPTETAEEAEERQAAEEMEAAAHEAALEAEADRIAAFEAKEAEAQTFIPEVMVQVATEVKEILTVDFVESSNKADEAMRAAAIARQEALQAGNALLMAQEELKKAKEEAEQAKREAEAAKEAARVAAEHAETNKRLAPKILAAEKSERIEQAKQLANVLSSLENRQTALESILRTADDSISITVSGLNRQSIDFSNKNLCKDIAKILLEKVQEAISLKQDELNTFNV